jgi:diguanylate cyclase (GGDEF)-like protein
MYSSAQDNASPVQRGIALSVALALAIAALLVLPHAAQRLPTLATFLPIFLTLAAGANLFIALLLAVQFRANGYLPLALLSVAYSATAVLIIAQSLAFPGLFAPEGLFGANPSTSIWLWAAWHGLFPLLVGGYAVGRRFPNLRIEPRPLHAYLALAGGLALGIGLAMIAFDHAYPVFTRDADYRSVVPAGWWSIFVIDVAALVIAIVATRGRSVLDLWLCVALLSIVCDTALTLSGDLRFSTGWYVARIYAIVTAVAIAVVFMADFATLYSRFARLATIDALTGIGNRRTFDERLDEALRASARDAKPLSLLMIDVDHFKAYNDTYGHFAGDETLRRVADAVRIAAERPHDAVMRYGGEEFAVILPDTDTNGAQTVADRVRLEVARKNIPHRSSRVAPYVTVSIGGTTLWGGLAEAREVIERADAALYTAKEDGRDRAVIGDEWTLDAGAGELIPEEEPASDCA